MHRRERGRGDVGSSIYIYLSICKYTSYIFTFLYSTVAFGQPTPCVQALFMPLLVFLVSTPQWQLKHPFCLSPSAGIDRYRPVYGTLLRIGDRYVLRRCKNNPSVGSMQRFEGAALVENTFFLCGFLVVAPNDQVQSRLLPLSGDTGEPQGL